MLNMEKLKGLPTANEMLDEKYGKKGEEYRMAYRLFRDIRETQRKNSRRQDSHRYYGQRPLSCGIGSEVKKLKKS